MAIPVYQSQGQLGAVASRVDNVKLDNSGSMAAAKAGAGIGNAIIEGADKLHQAMVTTDVMQANNEYNRQMNELQAKLYENKESKARDNMAKYEEGRAKILDSVMKKGPASMRDPMVRSAFMQTANKDWVNQQNRMRMYVLGEEEKNQDTQLNNGLQDCVSNITTAYNNDALLEDSVSKGAVLAGFRYANYGEERQKMEINKWKGMAYGQAINAAISGDNYDRAGMLLQGYGKYLDPKTRIAMDKIVSERKRNDLMLNNVNGLYSKFGEDVNGAWKEHAKSLTMDSGIKVSSYAKSQIGQKLGNNTCAIFVGKAVTAAGGDSSLISTLADGTYVNYEEKGLTFNDRNQLRDGDLVFWSVDGSGYTASNDRSAVNTDTHAYKGITHVGVYDAKSGKVIQSGTHGISGMDIDTSGYHFVGAAHQPDQSLSPTEMEKRRQQFTQAYMVNVNRQKYQDNLMVEKVAGQLLALSNDGQPRSSKDYENIIYNMTGNNWKMYSKLMPLASHFGKGGGYHELSLIERYSLEEDIDQGKFNQEELIKILTDMNIKPEKAMEYIRKNKQSIAKEGKIDWSLVKNAFYDGVGGKDKVTSEQMIGVMTAARRKVEEYSLDPKTKGQKIPMDTLVKYMQDTLLTGEAGEAAGGYGDYSVESMMRKSIYRIDKRDDGMLDVYFFGSDKPFPYPVTEEQLKERMK